MSKIAFPRTLRNTDVTQLSRALDENMRYLERLLNATFEMDHTLLTNVGSGDHHVKYTDAEVDAIVATHDAIVDAHHAKYTDGEVDTIVATHAAVVAAHHAKYLDADAVTAMGAKADSNPLNHDQASGGTGSWGTWTPTFTNFTLGDGTIDYARYYENDGLVIAKFNVVLGSTSVMGSGPRVSLPVTAVNWLAYGFIDAVVHLKDSGTLDFAGSARIHSATEVTIGTQKTNAGGYVGIGSITSSVPMTWTTDDAFGALVIYES